MDIKKAENIIDKMYQDKMKIREKQTNEGLELDLSKNVTFTELEEASVILLRNYLILKRKDEEKNKQMEVYEREFLAKLKEISKFHTCSYCSIINLLLELILLFDTKEIVDLIEVKKYIN